MKEAWPTNDFESEESESRNEILGEILSERKKRDADRSRAGWIEQNDVADKIASKVGLGSDSFEKRADNHQLEANIILFERNAEKKFSEYKAELGKGVVHDREKLPPEDNKRKYEPLSPLFDSLRGKKTGIDFEVFNTSPDKYINELKSALSDDRRMTALIFLKDILVTHGASNENEIKAGQKLREFVSANPRLFSSIFKDSNPDIRELCVGIVSGLLSGDKLQNRLGIALIKGNIKEVESLMLKPPSEDINDLENVVRQKLAKCEDKEINEVFQIWLSELIEKGNFDIPVLAAFEKTIRGKSRKKYESALSKFIESKGLDPQIMLKAWKHSRDNFLFNPNSLRKIEGKRPGSALVLNKEFGIRSFGRYPEEILINQFDTRNEDSPYGVFLYARGDHNGAFSQDIGINRKFWNDVKDKYVIRILEAGSLFEIGRRFISLDNRYGEKNKISFALIAGHGVKNSIAFGDGALTQLGLSSKGVLDKKHLQGDGAKRIKDFFVPNPEIVLFSCSTGKEGGIGQSVSDIYSANVVAPEIPAYPVDIRANFDENGKIHINSTFKDDSQRNYSLGKKI